jgi:hypothetical protein
LNLLYQTLQNNINQTEIECIDQLNVLNSFIYDSETGALIDETNSYLSTLRNAVSLIQTQINNNNTTLSVIR